MLTRAQILQMLVGLQETGDLDIACSNDVLVASCADGDRSTLKRIAEIVQLLYQNFDYTRSPEFLGLISGKSVEVIAMRRRLLTADKLEAVRRRLGKSLATLLELNDAYQLVEVGQHQQLDQLKLLASTLPG